MYFYINHLKKKYVMNETKSFSPAAKRYYDYLFAGNENIQFKALTMNLIGLNDEDTEHLKKLYEEYKQPTLMNQIEYEIYVCWNIITDIDDMHNMDEDTEHLTDIYNKLTTYVKSLESYKEL